MSEVCLTIASNQGARRRCGAKSLTKAGARKRETCCPMENRTTVYSCLGRKGGTNRTLEGDGTVPGVSQARDTRLKSQ
jgi:hypothetical protein